MLNALLFGLVASSALVIGGVIGAYWRLPDRLVAVALAFAGGEHGAVLASLADTLMPDAYREGGKPVAFATAAGFSSRS